MVIISLAVLYVVFLGFSCRYFAGFYKTRDKCSLWLALLGLLGIPGALLLGFLVFGFIMKYSGHSLHNISGGDPCGLLYPCPTATHELRDKLILIATGIVYLCSIIFSMVSFFRFYKTKNKCSLWLALLLLLGLPGILVLYGLFDYFVLK